MKINQRNPHHLQNPGSGFFIKRDTYGTYFIGFLYEKQHP